MDFLEINNIPVTEIVSCKSLKRMMQMTRLNEINIPDAPHTPRQSVTDIVHGVKIDDPYRWLEDGQSPETQAWTAAQNQRTEAAMQQLPVREKISNRLLNR